MVWSTHTLTRLEDCWTSFHRKVQRLLLGFTFWRMRMQERHLHFDPEDLGPKLVDATAHSLGIQHGGKQRLMVCSELCCEIQS